jgi:hypothetical protein
MSDVPSNLIPTRITGLPEYLGASTLGYLPYVIDGLTYKVQFSNIAAVGAVPSTREINTGSGLGGGGDLSANRTLYILPAGVDDSMLTTTGVTAATYGSAENVPVLTVNAQGRVTAATNTPIVLSNYVPTSRTITAGTGLSGGGDLSANRSFAVLFSSTTPEPLGPGNPGVSTVAARGDHVHPAVDLSDTTETQGVLPLSRGGTGNSLSPVVGAVVYSSNNALYLTPTSGNVGDVLVSAGGVAPPEWQAPIGGGTVTSINLTASTGISVSGGPITTSGSITVVNTAPDQVVALTGAGGTSISGTYPNFTITSTTNPGTVTSVDASGGTTGLSFTGGPITSSGTLTLGGTLAVANGGTGATTLGASGVLYGNGTSAIAATAVGTTGQVLVGNTAAAPSWATLASVAVTSFSAGTTGLTPSTATTGAVSLAGTLAVANGGTGATVAATARTNLSAAASGANTDITSIALTTGTISTAPASNNDLVNKQYVDTQVSSGIHFHAPVRVESPINLNATYNNGTAGVGATLTNAGTQAALVIDGVTVSAADRVLVYEQTDQTQNGIYVVTTVGSVSTNWVLTRSSDADTYVNASPNGLSEGSTVFVQEGTTGAGETYTCNTVGTITFGTTNITFAQISSAQIYSAGAGLTLTGTQFSLTAPVAVSLGGTGISSVGTAGNVLTSDGTVWSSQPPSSGGITYTTVKTSSYTATDSEGVQTDTSGGAFTVTLPATPAVGDQVIVVDTSSSWATNNLTVGRNGSTIEGLAENLVCDLSNVSVQLVYSGTTWNVFAQTGGAGGSGVTQVTGGGTGVATLTGYVKGSGTSPFTASATIPTSDLTGTLAVANGGTGATTLTGIVKGNGTSAFTAGTVSLTSEVTGTLPVANGGTGVTTSTGTVDVVLSNSPTLVTPTLGAASATSIAAALGSVSAPSYTFTGDTNTGIYSPAADTLAFVEGGVEALRLLSTGGITSPDLADAVGYKGLPQNSQVSAYTLALSDMGKHISITTGGVVIPANASVAFPIGATIVVFNNSGSSQTISITTDTLRLAGTATTGSRTLAQYGLATLVKVTSTSWVATGNVT